jgi:Uma2 family endonuclease
MSIVADVTQPLAEAVVPPAPQVRLWPLAEIVAPPASKVSLWRLSVDQYHAMLRHGIIGESENVELLDGILVAKMTKSTAHNVAKLLVQNALAKVATEGWYIDTQDAITLATSEPEPDVMVIRGEPRDYLAHHPRPGDLALVVEVSDSSLRHDQTFKKAIYATAAIQVYWIVNLVDQRIEVYTDPTGPDDQPDYRRRQEFVGTDQVPVVIADSEVTRIPVRELLP